MSDFVIREKDYDKLVANIETIAIFCTEQKAINNDFENLKKDFERVKSDYVSKSFIWKMITGMTVILSILGTLGFRTAFLDGYMATNDTNAELQSEMKATIDRQSALIDKLQEKLNS